MGTDRSPGGRHRSSGAAPLAGTRVLELGDESLSFAGRLLADLGAEVVMVEPPEGATIRRAGPFLEDLEGSEASLRHAYLDAGKRSVVLDRTRRAGEERLLDLIASADVLIESEMLEHPQLAAANPSLVHVTVSPFGLGRKWSGRKGSDLVAVAAGGLAWVCGDPEDPPNHPGGDQGYKLAGMAAASAAVMALAGRDRRGERPGVHLDVSVQEAVALALMQTSNPALWVWHGRIPKRPGITRVHRCADGGWVTLAVLPQRMAAFVAWLTEAGLPAPTAEGRDAITELGSRMSDLAAMYPRHEFMRRAWDIDLMCLPVNSVPDLDHCEHLAAIDEFTPVVHAPSGRTLRFPRSPLDAAGPIGLKSAPMLGADTADVLAVTPRRPSQPARRELPVLDVARALEGVRVVDFCWMIAGPLGTRLLANFGAEVIRVESGRRGYPDNFPEGYEDPCLGAFHNILDTAKLSTTIDPRTTRGRDLLLRLVSVSDVVVNNFRPGVMERMGLGSLQLETANPRVVNLAVPGCGSRGPWAQIGTFGNMISAASGLSYLTGFPDRPPRGLGVAYPDFSSPYLIPLLVLAGLRRRDETGEAVHMELNQLAATIALIGVEWLAYSSSGTSPPFPANRHPELCPHGVYPAAGEDEWLALAVSTDHEFVGLCDVIGRPELASDARFETGAARKQNEDALDDEIRRWSAGQDKWVAADALAAAGVAAAPVENIADAIEKDPQLSSHYQLVTQPGYPDLTVPTQRDPMQEAGRPRPVRRAPGYGEHNGYVLRELLGLSAEEVAELARNGVVRGIEPAPIRGARAGSGARTSAPEPSVP